MAIVRLRGQYGTTPMPGPLDPALRGPLNRNLHNVHQEQQLAARNASTVRTLAGMLGLDGSLGAAPPSSSNPAIDPTLNAAITAAMAPQAPPADALVVGPNMFIDKHNGTFWYGDMKFAIIPGIITAVAIKAIMFGGAKAGGIFFKKKT